VLPPTSLSIRYSSSGAPSGLDQLAAPKAFMKKLLSGIQINLHPNAHEAQCGGHHRPDRPP